MILCSGKDVLCVCVRWEERRETQDLDERNEVLKKKMYINKENTKYKSVAL